ncbi:MAG: ABC transporter permease, partial [Caldilineae bacterium]
MAVNATAAPLAAAPERPSRSLWSDSWRQLRKNKLAMPSIVFLVIVSIIAIFADTGVFTFFTGGEAEPLLAPYDYATANFAYVNAPPLTKPEEGPTFWLGADDLGRDVLSRTLYGARISLAVAFVAALVSLVVGIIYGMISGYSSTRVDNLMMRFVDFLYGFPIIIFIILMQVYFKSLSRRG